MDFSGCKIRLKPSRERGGEDDETIWQRGNTAEVEGLKKKSVWRAEIAIEECSPPLLSSRLQPPQRIQDKQLRI